MIPKLKTMGLTFVRSIPASPTAVYHAWLDPKNPGCPWNGAEKADFKPKVGGFFYMLHRSDEGVDLPHYGRFLTLKKGEKFQVTWMSRHTQGLESVLTVTFKQEGGGTLMTLKHDGLPDTKFGRVHKNGWEYFLPLFTGHLAPKKR